MAFIDLFSDEDPSPEGLDGDINPFDDDEIEVASDDFVDSRSVSQTEGFFSESLQMARECGFDDSSVITFFEELEILQQLFGAKEQRISEFLDETKSFVYYLLSSFIQAPDMIIAAAIRANPDRSDRIISQLEEVIHWIQSKQDISNQSEQDTSDQTLSTTGEANEVSSDS